jgi:hypothetical protein
MSSSDRAAATRRYTIYRRDAPVDGEALIHVGDVRLVEPEVHLQVDDGAHIVFEILALQLADRLLQELHVHLEADGIDVAALLAAEQVAGAANLEIEGGHAESAAEIAELLDRGKPLPRHRGERLFGWNQQVGEGRPITAADPAA